MSDANDQGALDPSGATVTPVTPSAAPQFELTTSRQFPNFLAEHRLSLAFTTYQAGKVFLLGLKPDGRVSVFERTLERWMGMVAGGLSMPHSPRLRDGRLWLHNSGTGDFAFVGLSL